MSLIIHAPNVHQGGGSVLLNDLVCAIPNKIPVTVFVDERMTLPADLGGHISVRRVRPTIARRLLAEIALKGTVTRSDTVLCFGNLPPLFKLRGHVTLFIQNRYIVDSDAPFRALPFTVRLRIKIEQKWLSWFRYNVNQYLVQTPTMQRLLEARLGQPVECLPFIPRIRDCAQKASDFEHPGHCDFVYVASSEAHKNHRKLIDAWVILAGEKVFPSLVLTICPDRGRELIKYLEEKRTAFRVRIHNVGNLPYDRVVGLYEKADALIYPSTFESFGLPLIEAKLLGLQVIASELDYVRDVVQPDQSFNPESPLSIARAVKRHLFQGKESVEPIDAKRFLDLVINTSKK